MSVQRALGARGWGAVEANHTPWRPGCQLAHELAGPVGSHQAACSSPRIGPVVCGSAYGTLRARDAFCCHVALKPTKGGHLGWEGSHKRASQQAAHSGLDT